MTQTTLRAYLARQELPAADAAELQAERRRLGAIHGGDLAEDGLRLLTWNSVMERRRKARENGAC